MRVLPLLILAACAVPLEDFPDRVADAICDRADECDELTSSYANCQSTTRGLVTAWINLAEGFNYEYQADGARSCVRAFRTRDCGSSIDFDEVCDEVWR